MSIYRGGFGVSCFSEEEGLEADVSGRAEFDERLV